MPKLSIDYEKETEIPVRLFLAMQGGDVVLRAQKGSETPWNVLFVGSNGTFTTGGMLPRSYNLNLDAEGYPIVKRYCDTI